MILTHKIKAMGLKYFSSWSREIKRQRIQISPGKYQGISLRGGSEGKMICFKLKSRSSAKIQYLLAMGNPHHIRVWENREG